MIVNSTTRDKDCHVTTNKSKIVNKFEYKNVQIEKNLTSQVEYRHWNPGVDGKTIKTQRKSLMRLIEGKV